MAFEFIQGVIIGLLELFFSLLLAVCAIFIGIKLFDRLTPEIDEFKELRKGNLAVAIVLGAIILSTAGMLTLGMTDFRSALPGLSQGMALLLVLLALAKLVWALFIALATLYTAFKILDTLTIDIDETKELKKRNVAVAVFIASVLLAATLVIASGARGLIEAPVFSVQDVGQALGIA